MGFEEFDGDEDIREEFPCPFCSEYFDIVGLCCHIDDEHPVEAKNGVLLIFCILITSIPIHGNEINYCFMGWGVRTIGNLTMAPIKNI